MADVLAVLEYLALMDDVILWSPDVVIIIVPKGSRRWTATSCAS